MIACAGGGPAVRPPVDPAVEAASSAAADAFQDLLSRLDLLIAAADADGTPPAALLAEARALRIEALAALAAGDDALARDFLAAAIALFGDDPR